VLTGTRLFNLAQREADIAFRIVPFNAQDVVQRRLVRLPYGVYIAVGSADPVFGDGAGFRLITHDTSTGQFPDIAWLQASFPNARPLLTSNNRNVQARSVPRGSASPCCRVWWATKWPACVDLTCRTSRPPGTSGWATTAICAG
jgi:DNA-binding transcriptional LysR family regulator